LLVRKVIERIARAKGHCGIFLDFLNWALPIQDNQVFVLGEREVFGIAFVRRPLPVFTSATFLLSARVLTFDSCELLEQSDSQTNHFREPFCRSIGQYMQRHFPLVRRSEGDDKVKKKNKRVI
jgi:hypothetical protein